MYAIKVTNKYTGKAYLYPTLYQGTEEELKNMTIPQKTQHNQLEIIEIHDSKRDIEMVTGQPVHCNCGNTSSIH